MFVALEERVSKGKACSIILKKFTLKIMSRRNSRSILSSSAAQSPKREMSPGAREKEDKDDKRSQRRNKLFRRIQMDIKVEDIYIYRSTVIPRIVNARERKWVRSRL